MSDLRRCDRCGSKIVAEPHRAYPNRLTLTKGLGDGNYTSQDAELCSMCWDDLWDWAFGDGTPDRSGVADPMPLERMASSVESHIEALEEILSALDEAGYSDAE